MIPFVKASACGNDFLIVDESATSGERKEMTRRLCDRRSGIGADGIQWILPARNDLWEVSACLINADGSEAEISGNGTRCVAAWMASEDPSLKTVRVQTGAGVKVCELMVAAGRKFTFTTKMGRVRVGERISVCGVEGIRADLGNPHMVVIAEALPERWRDLGRCIQSETEIFPHGVNVEFARVKSRRNMAVAFYERGAGETRSSGTGSCAAAAAARDLGLIDDWVEVAAPGGAQIVAFHGDEILLTGTAEIICRGDAFL